MSRRDGEDAPYWEALANGKLQLPRCEGCDRWVWPATHRCSACGALGVNWVDLPMKGTVFSWTRTWHRFGYTESLDLPFTTVLVTVDGCGIRLLGRLDDPGQVDPRIDEALVGRPGETIVGTDRIPTIIWSRCA